MRQARIDRAIEVMRANNLPFNRYFQNILGVGFNDEAREGLCKEILTEIEKILVYGVNNGFTINMKNAVLHLTDIAMRTCSTGFISVRLSRLTSQKNSCIAMLKLPELNVDSDIRLRMRGYIEHTQMGMNLLVESNSFTKHVAEKNNESTCKKVLEKMLWFLDSTIDFSSPQAAERYNAAVSKLREWRTSMARADGYCDFNSVSLIKSVCVEIEEWSKLSVAAKVHAKEEDIFPIPEDDLTRAVKSENTRRNVEMFLERCDDYIYAVYEMSNNGVGEKVRKIRENIAKAQKELNKLEYERNHGVIPEDDYEYYAKRLQNELDMLTTELERVQLDEFSRRELQLRRQTISRIEQPIRTSYNQAKNNRLHIHSIFAGMDFSRIIAMLNNNLSVNEIEDAITDIRNTLIARGFIDDRGNLILNAVTEEFGAEYDAAIRGN